MAEIHIKWGEIDKFLVDVRKTRKGRMGDIVKGMKDAMLLLDHETQRHLRGGNPLFRGTGKLANSVRGSAIKVLGSGSRRRYKAEFGVIGRSTSKGPGLYGRVWEYGAQTPGHIVKPKPPKKFLVFRSRWKMGRKANVFGIGKIRRAVKHGEGTGHLIFAKQVKMSPKPWLGPSFDKKRAGMIKIIEKAGGKVVDDLKR